MKADELLSAYESVGLHSINKVAAAFRYDTKFIAPVTAIAPLLEALRDQFAVLEVADKRVHYYETVYFDTADYKLYMNHHNGKPNRMKVRIRKYDSSGEIFFEVKHKLKGSKTGKLRLPRQKMMFEISPEEWHAIQQHDKSIHGLEKKLITTFHRITLNNKATEERITIDTDLCFNNFSHQKCMPEIVIIEVKHTNPHVSAVTQEVLRQIRASGSSFSKYAIGVALLENNVKKNLFKPTLLQLQKTIHGFI